MLEEFKNFIDTQKLFHPENKVLLAVSGGVDSMVMAHLFHHSRYRFAVAHCNFQLREEASLMDEEFVRQAAESYDVEFIARRFETEKYAREQRVSIQMAARELRYKWFEEMMPAMQCQFLATAHHLNDAFETALFNLVRGTGINGLKGIMPMQDYRIRPLLFSDRKKIKSFADSHGIKWREDQSNTSLKYHRNFIRHEVVPLLEKINPDLVNNFSESSKKIAAANNIVASMTADFKEKLIKASGKEVFLNKKVIVQEQEGRFLLFEVLKSFGFNFSQVTDIYDKLDVSGKRFISKDYQLNVDREDLIVSPIREESFEALSIELDQGIVYTHDFSLSLEKVSSDGFSIPDDKNIAAFDFEKLKFPLKLKSWERGDRFVPLGMKHKKKLSDFMIDEKIPLNLKSRVLVLKSAEDIVWVIGHRIDDRYKVTKDSRQIFLVKKQTDD